LPGEGWDWECESMDMSILQGSWSEPSYPMFAVRGRLSSASYLLPGISGLSFADCEDFDKIFVPTSGIYGLRAWHASADHGLD